MVEDSTFTLILAVIVGGVIVGLWVLMPFAVFGIKKRLEMIHDAQRDVANSLKRIERLLMMGKDDHPSSKPGGRWYT